MLLWIPGVWAYPTKRHRFSSRNRLAGKSKIIYIIVYIIWFCVLRFGNIRYFQASPTVDNVYYIFLRWYAVIREKHSVNKYIYKFNKKKHIISVRTRVVYFAWCPIFRYSSTIESETNTSTFRVIYTS